MTAFNKNKDRGIRRRETLNKEKHLIEPDRTGRFTSCIVYPNSYQVGMSNLGFHTLYRIVNNNPDIYCERAFFDETISSFGESFESETNLSKFDILLFSVSFELDYINSLLMMRAAGIPLLSVERGEDMPLIIFGGVVPTANPEPIADFADLIFIGEAEVVFPQSLTFLIKSKLLGKPRSITLHEIADEDGVYIPSLYRPTYYQNRLHSFNPRIGNLPERIKRVYVKDVDKNPAESVIITDETTMADMFLLELNRGCPRSCDFCLARLSYKPMRSLAGDTFKERVLSVRDVTKKVGLVGTSLTDYPDLNDLLTFLKEEGFTARFSSVRGDALKFETLRLINTLGQNTITTAPEVGDDGLREKLKKGITNDEFFQFFRDTDKIDFSTLKLYFMLGVGSSLSMEEEMLINFVEDTLKYFKRNVVVSISPFVPKPHTPLALFNTPVISDMKKSLKRLTKKLFMLPVNDVRVESPRLSEVQRLLSLGDRRAGDYLLRAVKSGKYPKLTRDEHSILPVEGFLTPWDFIDITGKAHEE